MFFELNKSFIVAAHYLSKLPPVKEADKKIFQKLEKTEKIYRQANTTKFINKRNSSTNKNLVSPTTKFYNPPQR